MTQDDSELNALRAGPGGAPVLGAYGLRLGGLADASAAMQPVPAAAAMLDVSVEQSGVLDAAELPSEITASLADVRLITGGRLRMRRGEGTVRFWFPTVPTADDLLHPYLAPAAALVQLWQGREAFHAGAFATRNGAVLLLGGKEAGKSTTLAWLATQHGMPVLADDLAVITEESVLAGPRCIDLRADAEIASATIGQGRPVREQGRRRMMLPRAPDAVSLAATVVLGWGNRVAIERVPLSARLRLLVSQRMFHAQLAPRPLDLLGVLAAPMWSLTRARGEAGLAAGVEALLSHFA
ncbi:MAG: hypothetical protein WAK93_09200 [Solirubrobacteraceae bacterium]